VGAQSAERREALLNIGQVLELLHQDFEGLISISKLRGLEDDGLIKPQRTPSGYRKFSHADVERLRYILRMQRDHYLPRRVIREHLDAMDRGLTPPEPDPVVPTVPKVAIGEDGLPAPESFRRTDRLRLSRKELIKVAEIDDGLLTELWRQVGLLHRAGIAHGDLVPANCVADGDGRPWLVDYDQARAASGTALLERDRAELLAALSALVGPERAKRTSEATMV